MEEEEEGIRTFLMDARVNLKHFLNDRRLPVVLILCFVLRLAVLILYPDGFWSTIGTPIGVDSWSSFAERLVGTGDYQPGVNRPPVFPLFLAAFYAVFGVNYFIARVVLIFLDVGSCVAIYLLAHRLFSSRTVSLCASIVWALYFPEFPYVTHIWAEPLFTLLLLLFVFSMLRAYSSPGVASFVLMGVLYGLLNLTRTGLNAFFIVMAFLYCIRFRPFTFVRLRLFFIFLLTSIIVVSPWGMRNYFRFGRFTIASSMVGFQLYCVVHTFEGKDFVSIRAFDYDGAFQDIKDKLKKRGVEPGFDQLNDAERNDVYLKESIRIICRHPVKYLMCWLNSLLSFCVGISDFSFFSWRSMCICAANSLLILWALIGFIRYRGPWIGVSRPIIALILYSTFSHVSILVVSSRYALPLIPSMALFASYGLVNSVRAIKTGCRSDSSGDREMRERG